MGLSGRSHGCHSGIRRRAKIAARAKQIIRTCRVTERTLFETALINLRTQLQHYNERMVTMETVKQVPSVERWTHMMNSSSPEEALRLWQLAIECLDATHSQDQQGWGGHIGIAERVLRERGIPRWEGDV